VVRPPLELAQDKERRRSTPKEEKHTKG